MGEVGALMEASVVLQVYADELSSTGSHVGGLMAVWHAAQQEARDSQVLAQISSADSLELARKNQRLEDTLVEFYRMFEMQKKLADILERLTQGLIKVHELQMEKK